ncbi:putative tonB domain protein [Burkholderia multivorans]|nr:putative tonB domain protein [Burkholderia multivorans]
MRTTSPTTRTIPSKRRGAAADRRNSRCSVQAMRRWSGDRTARARFPRRAAIALRIARSRPQRHGVSGAARCRISGIRAARYGRYSGDRATARHTRLRAARRLLPGSHGVAPDRARFASTIVKSLPCARRRVHNARKPSDARSRTSTQRFGLEGARRRVGWVRSGIAVDRSRGRGAVTGRRSDGRGAAERVRGAMPPSRGVRPEQT